MEKEKKGKNALVKRGAADDKLIEINVGGQVLNVIDPNVEQMFVEPKPHHGTAIALLMSRCIVPIQMNVFEIPERLLAKIAEEARNAEMMMPVEMVNIRAEVAAFKDELAGLAATLAGEDFVTMFIPEAVKNANGTARDYLVSVLELCDCMAGFKKRYASSDAFYQAQTLGSDTVEPDSNAIVVSIQNHILDMNKMSAGWGGYRIMALLKVINQTAKLLDNPQIKALFGAADALAMLNKLDFRIQPDQMAFSGNLCQLAEMVKEIGETKKLDKKTIGRLITLCMSIKSYKDSE
jgi:hypothetical protein